MIRVGFVGVGTQGAPIARRIIEAGYPTTIYARRPEARVLFEGTAALADSLAAMAADSDLVGICVVDDDGVEDVLCAPGGILEGLRPGSIVAVHSTIHPDTCRRLVGLVEERGSTLLDAPVSGGPEVASRGELLVMVGGETAAFERAREVFETFGAHVAHLGGVGSGQIVKLINNTLFTAHLSTAAGALELGRSLGLDPTELADLLNRGSARSGALSAMALMHDILEGFPSFAAALLRKDVRHLVDVAGGPERVPKDLLEPADRALGAMGAER